MGNDNQYQGSQAFAHVLDQKSESVNPNTGSLHFFQPLINLRGIRDSIDLKLNLTYAAGNRGTFGLPGNWGLDLPYVLPDASLTAKGRTYAIDFSWADISDYPSGLKYINNHGMKFEKVAPALPLPSGQRGLYGYKLQCTDGSCDYFDEHGKPMEHDDIFGNYVYYSYASGEQSNVLAKDVSLGFILDSWGQKVTFQYQPQMEIYINLPDGNKSHVKFSTEGVFLIVDPAGHQTKLEYIITPFSQRVLSRVTYPTGLVSRFDYIGIRYLDTNGAEHQMPAITDHRHYDSSAKVLMHSNYRYGTISGNTYTGASKGSRLSGSNDGLIDSGGQIADFRYVFKVLWNDKTYSKHY